MDRKESLERLSKLLDIIKNYESASLMLQKAEQYLTKAKYSLPGNLNTFDAEHKEDFIIERIGSEPVMPQGLIKFAVPLYLAKKRRYKRDNDIYQKILPLAEAAYREEFAEQRRILAEQDSIEKQANIKEKEIALYEAQQIFAEAKAELEQDDLLSEKMKTVENVNCLIDILKDHRADTLKEAVNLLYDERRKDEEERREAAHRQEMIELEEERVRAAQSAEEFARRQYEEAAYAAEYALQAAINAQEAADNAKDAAESAQRIELNQLCNTDYDK